MGGEGLGGVVGRDGKGVIMGRLGVKEWERYREYYE